MDSLVKLLKWLLISALVLGAPITKNMFESFARGWSQVIPLKIKQHACLYFSHLFGDNLSTFGADL